MLTARVVAEPVDILRIKLIPLTHDLAKQVYLYLHIGIQKGVILGSGLRKGHFSLTEEQ